MTRTFINFSVVLITLFLLSGACSAGQCGAEAKRAAHYVPGRAPDEHAVVALVGHASVGSLAPNDDDADASLSDRILDGFEAGLSGLETGDGYTVVWGFEYQQGTQQSMAVYGPKGHLMLAAIVDDVARVTDAGHEVLASPSAYRKWVGPSGMDLEPRGMVFATSRVALEAAYPLVLRWLQADLVGFNAKCAKTPAACRLATEIQIPLTTYLPGPRGPREVTSPTVFAATIPLDTFIQ